MNHSQKIITKCDGIITNCDSLVYYKVRHGLLKIATGIKKCDYYYKLRQYRPPPRLRQTLAISARGRDNNSNPFSTSVLQFSLVHAQNSSRDWQLRFASSWFVKSAWVSLESNLQKLLSNNSPRAFVLFFCFAPSGFKYFSRKISTDRLF